MDEPIQDTPAPTRDTAERVRDTAQRVRDTAERTHDTPELELARLRRALSQRTAGSVHCGRCQRAPLIGEHIYVYKWGAVLCELCRALEHRTPVGSQMMHGPAFGHTMRVTRQPAA